MLLLQTPGHGGDRREHFAEPVRAEASARRADHAAALADFADSAAILEDLGARPQLARVLRGWGEALCSAGRLAESDTTLHRALSLFEELGIEPEAEGVRDSLTG
ncbi:MAG: hypothetical protein LC798_21605, partial [Chloroflexi bacterium]|nr:hypothetical protein [Chloroflexota bacterium]